MSEQHVIALDQGTTSSRAVLVDRAGRFVDMVQRPFEQIFPQPGWVEHNPSDILASQLGCLTELVNKHGLTSASISGIGIDNQRETTIVWDPSTGQPIANAIVWQCRRTAKMVDELCAEKDVRDRVRATTGLTPDAYFSASKVAWLLDHVEGARERAEAGELLFGTVDTWLVWVLTGGLVHATDMTNASRTMLYDIHNLRWDPWLLDLFGIPSSMLPKVLPSASVFGETSYPGVPAGVPICGVAGDQQAALFGQCCFGVGQAKNTYGTGCFLLTNTGERAVDSTNGLVTTIAATPPSSPVNYALEGSVFVAGALIQWLRDELGIIRTAAETEGLARSVSDTGGVYIVPAFTGLGAPWWDADARGLICGLTRGTGRAEIARAALESLAYQVCDLARAMEVDSGAPLTVLNADGGASQNDFLMQFQADLLGCELRRPANVETTSLGAAYLAGLTCGFWSGTEELRGLRASDEVFSRTMPDATVNELVDGWHRAVARATGTTIR